MEGRKEPGLKPVRSLTKRRTVCLTKTKRSASTEVEFLVQVGETADEGAGELGSQEGSKRKFSGGEASQVVNMVVEYLSDIVLEEGCVEFRGDGCRQYFAVDSTGDSGRIRIFPSRSVATVENTGRDMRGVQEGVNKFVQLGSGAQFQTGVEGSVQISKHKEEANLKISKLRQQMEDLRNVKAGALDEHWGPNDWCTTISTIVALIYFYKLQLNGYTTRTAEEEAAWLIGKGCRQFARYRKRFEENGTVGTPLRGKWKREAAPQRNFKNQNTPTEQNI
ncbi:hypothetical protein NDN08_007912 [Rhodosorus marinus]|uniref:Uncharacterized protein n=1 Tax=Rhodosorus marinus TaxID=101924 RepID=A0AAV8V305_9RHOD|nr:hypothetical protein NDN08_007912 [Rhodosorus marinus]